MDRLFLCSVNDLVYFVHVSCPVMQVQIQYAVDICDNAHWVSECIVTFFLKEKIVYYTRPVSSDCYL